MTTAFVLALVSGVFHAAWNALARSTGKERGATFVTLLGSFVVAGAVALVSPNQTLTWSAWPWWLLAGLGEATYVYCLGVAYSQGDLAVTYTVSRATALVVIWPLSFFAFGTAPTLLLLGATAVVALGITLTRPASTGARWSVPWTLATGTAVGAYHTGYKGLMRAGTSPAVGFVASIALALPLLFVALGPSVRRDVAELVRRPRLWLASVLCGASFLLMIHALVTAESGRILGVRNASVGFAVLLSVAMGERLSKRQWLGVAVLFGGVALFALESWLAPATTSP